MHYKSEIVSAGKENSIDKRGNIIQIATKLFGERGFEDVSTRDIAQAADVNIALIAYYFKSKEGLFDAIIDERIPSFGLRISEIKTMNLSAWQKLTLVIDEYCDRLMVNPDFNRMIYRQLSYSQRSPTSQKILAEIHKNRDSILEIFEEGKLKGDFNLQTDYHFVLFSFFSTVSTAVKSPSMVAAMMNLETEQDVFSKPFMEKFKRFMRDFFYRFTMTENKNLS